MEDDACRGLTGCGQLIRGLQAAEQVGISGFDLHPSRIWLNYQGEVKICTSWVPDGPPSNYLGLFRPH